MSSVADGLRRPRHRQQLTNGVSCEKIEGVFGWYLGAALEFAIGSKLLVRRWVRRLPCFSAYTAMGFFGGLALMAAYDPKDSSRYEAIYRVCSPIGLALQLAASIEAFWWCAARLPRFRRVGLYLMLFCAGVALALQSWTKDASVLTGKIPLDAYATFRAY
jgi:hypothetical protein